MKILILNQHTSNHGDEAAGKALIKGLRDFGITNNVDILYNVDNLLEIEKFKIDKNLKHFDSGNASFIDKVLLILTFVMPFSIIKHFYIFGDFIKFEYDLISKYDKIINGPGGVNIGPYKDWKYIWRLYVALKLKKPVAMYSISFGPIPDTYIFNKISKYILRNVKFLSLRDNKSQAYADELSIKHIKSIDTAFLNNQTQVEIPLLLKEIGDNYVIVVPNQLNKWHPNFKHIKSVLFDELYLNIINYFLDKKLKVILLPQLFGMQNDSKYFELLKEKSLAKDNIIIVDDSYSSDIQQQIISKASFLVGARYHTVIFSVNNKRPFLSLAYEHKMTNTLELLGLGSNNVLIQDIVDGKINIYKILDNKLNNIDSSILEIKKGSDKANLIAKNTLERLVYEFLGLKNENE